MLEESQGDRAWTQILMVDLRKLLYEKAKGKGALLGATRCGLNIFLPSVVGYKYPFDNLIPRNAITPLASIPMASGPLTAQPYTLFCIEDWIEQPILFIAKEYSFKDIINILANIDGAHADTQEQIEDKSEDMMLIQNE